MLRWWPRIMLLFLIPINRMISHLKLGNGRSWMSAFVCVDGMRRVLLHWIMSLMLAIKYYLLGNPIVVWSSTASIGVFGIVAAIYLLRWQRHYIDFTPAYLDHIHFAGIYPVLGWGLHYLPFFIMGRYDLLQCDLTSVCCTCITIFRRFTLPS